MSAPDPSQPEQMPVSPEEAAADPSPEPMDDDAIQRALEETETAARRVQEEASAEVDDADEDMFASIESFLADLEGLDDPSQLPDAATWQPTAPSADEAASTDAEPAPAESAADTPQDAVDDVFAQAMAELGDEAMSAPAEVEAEAEAAAAAVNAAPVQDAADDVEPTAETAAPTEEAVSEPVIEEPAAATSEIEFPPPVETPDVALDAAGEMTDEQSADLTLDDELSNQLDDLFQTDMNDLDEVLNDVFGPEDAAESEMSEAAAAHTEAPAPAAKAEKTPRPASPAIEPEAAAPGGATDDASEEQAAEEAVETTTQPSPSLGDQSAFDAPPQAATAAAKSAPAAAAPAKAAKPAGTPAAATASASAPRGGEPAASSDSAAPGDSGASTAAPAPMVVNAAPPSAELEPRMDSPLTDAIRQILYVMNRPVQSLPESKRTLVSWFALTLAMWVPIVWIAAWYLYRP